jgi:dihydrofolate reductase
MRKVIAGAFISLDGVMQAPGGPEEDRSGGFAYGGWTVNYWDDAMGRFMDETFSAPFDLLLGRKTYEMFAAHWPQIESGEYASIAATFNAARKYVATSSTAPLSWKNSVALHDAETDVAKLKQEDGPTLLIQGSSQLMQSLLAADLIDEFSLLVFPLVLGSGKRLFGAGAIPAAFKLIGEAKTSTTGVIMGRYERAGAVTTGSFALSEPTQAELARRERIAREG